MHDSGDEVGAAQPVGFGEVGDGGLGGVIGVGVVEAEEFASSGVCFAQDADQVFGSDLVVARGGWRCVGGGDGLEDGLGLRREDAEKNAAALVRVVGLAVAANLVVDEF